MVFFSRRDLRWSTVAYVAASAFLLGIATVCMVALPLWAFRDFIRGV